MQGEGSISCQDLWMVFGDQAKSRLTAASEPDRAQQLRDQGLITAVAGVSFDIKPGELFVIMGLSGSGKSTLIRCISRLIEPTAGSVLIDGDDILAASKAKMIELRRQKLGMVFQHFGLFPHLSVLDNVAFPLRVQGIGKSQRYERAQTVIDLVGLNGREANYPRQLSGGQRQRVGIARSLAVNPEIWFLDEPFSALDPLIRRQLQDEFLKLQADLKKTILFITHDITEALKLADRIAIMRDGAIVQIGTPADIVLRPADSYVAEFARDVPRGQLMTVAAMMASPESAGDCPPDAPILKPGMTLDAALAVCAANSNRIKVEDDHGRLVGTVTLDDLAKAIGGNA